MSQELRAAGVTATAWHVVTGEFPPAPGGVSDYSFQLTTQLVAAGDTVHVWCPDAPGPRLEPAGLHVHRMAGTWSGADLRRLDGALNETPAPRRLLVQWVPHAFGRRSMNLAFCRWVRRRARRGDEVDLMVHEPFLAFHEGSYRQDAAAAVHRVMVAILLAAARRVWVAIPAWSRRLRPWALGRELPYCWLPVPSNVARCLDTTAVAAVRGRLPGSPVFGHFGTYGADSRAALGQVVPLLLERAPAGVVLLMGHRGDEFADDLRHSAPHLAPRLFATGRLDAPALSINLQACDVLLQPYSDGASTRRTTLMTALEHGLPVVTTYGRLSEPLWKESPAVTAVSAGDVDAMVDAALALAASGTRREEQGRQARALYDRRFAVRHAIASLRSDACLPV
jgi:glycosyltransferase involved in cell wall biosynthesis